MSLHHHTSSLGSDVAASALKSSPALAVTASAAAGMSLEEWVFAATLVYLVLQILYLLFKWYRDMSAPRESGGE